MPPWEKYQQQAPGAGPWQKYQGGPEPTAPRPSVEQPAAYQPSLDVRRMPTTGTPEEFGQNLTGAASSAGQAALSIAQDQLPLAKTHYQNLAHFGGMLGGPSIADMAGKIGVTIPEPAAEDQSRYRDEVVMGALSAGAGMVGRSVGSRVVDGLKYLGRGGRSVKGLERFVGDNAKYVTQQGASGLSILNPPLSGAAVNYAIDATDVGGMQQHELAGDTAAATLGAGTTALVAKNTIDDLLLGNERWRELMKKPSSGAAGGLLTALITYLASRGMLAAKDQINDAVDYVADLFPDEGESAQ